MRTTLELPDEQLAALNALGRARKVPPEVLVQQAVNEFLDKQPELKKGRFEDDPAFGIWRDRNIDGVEYQRQIRAEWDREWDQPT